MEELRAIATVDYSGAVVTSDAPRLRGRLHVLAFYAAIPIGFMLTLEASTPIARVAALLFALSVVAMFGTSSLFHRISWNPVAKGRMAVLDHTMIYGLIAGTYTPFALLVLRRAWGIPMLVLVCAGGVAAVTAKVIWRNPPTWVAAATCVGLGSIALLVFPQIAVKIGAAGTLFLAAGGVAYTIGAVVYALERPDPFPRTFGYHEIFHYARRSRGRVPVRNGGLLRPTARMNVAVDIQLTSRRLVRVGGACFSALALVACVLVARRLSTTSWPLDGARPVVLARRGRVSRELRPAGARMAAPVPGRGAARPQPVPGRLRRRGRERRDSPLQTRLRCQDLDAATAGRRSRRPRGDRALDRRARPG